MCVLSRISCVQLSATYGSEPARLFCRWGFSMQEYWCGWPCPPPGDVPDPGMEPLSLMSPALADRLFTTSATC